MKLAAWIAGALCVGWLITAGIAVAFPGGHPPFSFYAGGLVVLLSLVMAPIGVRRALVSVREARRERITPQRGAVALLILNGLLMVVASLPLLLALWQLVWFAAFGLWILI